MHKLLVEELECKQRWKWADSSQNGGNCNEKFSKNSTKKKLLIKESGIIIEFVEIYLYTSLLLKKYLKYCLKLLQKLTL